MVSLIPPSATGNRLTAVRRLSDDALLLQIGYDAVGRRVESAEYIDPATGTLLDPPRVTRHVYVGIQVIEEYTVTEGERKRARFCF